MRKLLLVPIVVGLLSSSCNPPKPEMAAAPVKTAAIEFGDSSKANMCKVGLMALAAGDVDAFTANIADNAVYMWNSGDSIAGKDAIVTYWKDRRGNTIDKMEITNDIWLTLKINESKQVKTGDYAFVWAKVNATYKGGKSMSQWIHNVYHFDGMGKIDRVTQWLDRAPIMAAMPMPPKKK